MSSRSELIKYANYVWDEEEKARLWLRQPHAMLGGVAPMSKLNTPGGISEVETLLKKLFFGLPS
jgi:uncharacterized protein (DUF2384 family)